MQSMYNAIMERLNSNSSKLKPTKTKSGLEQSLLSDSLLEESPDAQRQISNAPPEHNYRSVNQIIKDNEPKHFSGGNPPPARSTESSNAASSSNNNSSNRTASESTLSDSLLNNNVRESSYGRTVF